MSKTERESKWSMSSPRRSPPPVSNGVPEPIADERPPAFARGSGPVEVQRVEAELDTSGHETPRLVSWNPVERAENALDRFFARLLFPTRMEVVRYCERHPEASHAIRLVEPRTMGERPIQSPPDVRHDAAAFIMKVFPRTSSFIAARVLDAIPSNATPNTQDFAVSKHRRKTATLRVRGGTRTIGVIDALAYASENPPWHLGVMRIEVEHVAIAGADNLDARSLVFIAHGPNEWEIRGESATDRLGDIEITLGWAFLDKLLALFLR